MELYDSLTVADNVAMGSEALLAGGKPSSQLLGSRGDSDLVTEAVRNAMSIVEITELADRQVGVLSTGQRRLVELARALAGTYDILLLDEPSSGLDGGETQSFGLALRRAVSERGIGDFASRARHDPYPVRVQSCLYARIWIFDLRRHSSRDAQKRCCAGSVPRSRCGGSECARRTCRPPGLTE